MRYRYFKKKKMEYGIWMEGHKGVLGKREEKKIGAGQGTDWQALAIT